MTISADYAPGINVGNGVTTAFPVNFPFGAKADLLINLFNTSTGANLSPAPVLNGAGANDYTVSGTPDADTGIYPSGTVTFNTAPSSTYKIVRERVTPQRQNASLTNNGPFPAKTVEGSFDRGEMQLQERSDTLSRALVAPASDGTTSMALQPVSQRANQAAVFDSQGKLVASAASATDLANLSALNSSLAAMAALGGSLTGDAMFARPVASQVSAPSGAESNGTRYLIKNGSGTFAGKSNLIAEKVSGSWIYSVTPQAAQRIFVTDQGLWYVYRNTWWNRLKTLVSGAVYQHFGDVPAGTTANGIVLATGQTLQVQGPGSSSQINNGRYEPSDNSYMVASFPYKDMRMSITGMYRGSGAVGSLVLAQGRLAAGAIITKMIHSEFLYQSQGDLSIWGGVRQDQPGYASTSFLQSHYRLANDTNYPLHALSVQITHEMVVQGNLVKCYGDGRYFSDSYRDDMVTGAIGDDESGNLGYVYFQTGGVVSPNLPYVYEIFAEPIAAIDDMPDPLTIPSTASLPFIKTTACAFGAATEVGRFTPADGSEYAFEVTLNTKAAGGVAAYAQATRAWIVQVKKYAGNILISTPAAIYAEQQLSTNGGVITLSDALSAVQSGSDVLFKATTSRTGSDATSYSPLVTATILTKGDGATLT